MTCTFSDGTLVESRLPLATSTDTSLPDLTIRRSDGSVCGTFSDGGGVRLVTAGEVIAMFVQEPGPRLTLRCNGDEVVSDTFSKVVACGSAGVPLPSWSAELDNGRASLTVFAVGQSEPLFECSR